MKNLLILIFCAFYMLSCEYNEKNITEILTIDQYENNRENEILAKNLLCYNYAIFLLEEVPDLKTEELDNVVYQYFIPEDDDGKITFRLIVKNSALKHEGKLIEFFERTVKTQVKHQTEEEKIFSQARDISRKAFMYLDNQNYDEFWKLTSTIFKEHLTKENFINIFSSRADMDNELVGRQFNCQVYYQKLPNVKGSDFYAINYTYENGNQEQFTFRKEDGILKITGYDSNFPL